MILSKDIHDAVAHLPLISPISKNTSIRPPGFDCWEGISDGVIHQMRRQGTALHDREIVVLLREKNGSGLSKVSIDFNTALGDPTEVTFVPGGPDRIVNLTYKPRPSFKEISLEALRGMQSLSRRLFSRD